LSASTGDVSLTSTLTYAGPQELRIEGRGATITGPAGGDALTVTGGADLTLRDVTVAGAGGHGVYVDVPAGAAGTVDVALHGVALATTPERALGGGPGACVPRRRVADHPGEPDRAERLPGRGRVRDFDGVRVNEGGAGDLELEMHRVVVTGNAADGVELDEKGVGDVAARVQHTVFDDNGDQPQNPDDLEDGFDIDEADAGTSGPGSRTSAPTATRTRGSTWTRRGPRDPGRLQPGGGLPQPRQQHHLTEDEGGARRAGASSSTSRG
jgi:hypothetical protein